MCPYDITIMCTHDVTSYIMCTLCSSIVIVVRKAAEDGITPIVVDNTHTQAWEMEPCVKTCLQHGYRPVLAEPATSWRYKAKDLAK